MIIKKSGIRSKESDKLFKITGFDDSTLITSIGSLLSRIKSGSISLSSEAYGVATELKISVEGAGNAARAAISDLNRVCGTLLNAITPPRSIYIFFDELELFYQTTEQFDRDRRIIRDLVFAISQLNAESAENGRNIYICSTLRTEVLHSVLELGHEIGRDIDDYGLRLDWSGGKDALDHPLMNLIARKIAKSVGMKEYDVWEKFFPARINNQLFFKYILNSSYYRPRDIVRLLRVARDFRDTDEMFTTEHFDKTSLEYSKQTWLEVTEELLASYSHDEIASLQRLFLGSKTHFYRDGLVNRAKNRYKSDRNIQEFVERHKISKILSDLYRIGVIGNDFYVPDASTGKKKPRNRWIFRGNTTLNDSERMSVHKSLWKHLSLVPGTLE